MAGTLLRALPSVDEVLRSEPCVAAAARFGRPQTVAAVRRTLEAARASLRNGGGAVSGEAIAAAAAAALDDLAKPRLRAIYNLTGTVLHTNLGRARLAEAAVEAAVVAMREAVTLEYDLEEGRRGERDDHIRGLLCELTGAEDATVVNNNAAALMLVLSTLVDGREAVVSRGELIEIGGAFRLPDIMARSGARLREIGTTNRTHLDDYRGAIGPTTGLVLKVHTSNYRIEGFTASVGVRDLAGLCRDAALPLVDDLGSGTLIDLVPFGLEHEPTVAEALADGADLVTFSGDKLLGGPQSGFIVGRRDLLAKINRNPMKRAMRIDKIRMAALEATLRLYRDPARLAANLPTLRALVRPQAAILEVAEAVRPDLARAAGPDFLAEVVPCESEIGSGALPLAVLPSAAVRFRRAGGRSPEALAADFRRRAVPVIGRIAEDALWLDCRCLEDVDGFRRNLQPEGAP